MGLFQNIEELRGPFSKNLFAVKGPKLAFLAQFLLRTRKPNPLSETFLSFTSPKSFIKKFHPKFPTSGTIFVFGFLAQFLWTP